MIINYSFACQSKKLEQPKCIYRCKVEKEKGSRDTLIMQNRQSSFSNTSAKNIEKEARWGINGGTAHETNATKAVSPTPSAPSTN